MANEKVSAKLRFDIFKRDDFTCQYCGKKSPEVILEVDHIIPVSQGGTCITENLTTACYQCNRGKGAGLLDSILKDKDIREETILLAEREMQLKEYNAVLEQVRERESGELDILHDHFVEKFRQKYGASKEFDRAMPTIRTALKIMSYVEIMNLIDYAVERTQYDTRGDSYSNAAAKYLCGILRNKLKDHNNVG